MFWLGQLGNIASWMGCLESIVVVVVVAVDTSPCQSYLVPSLVPTIPSWGQKERQPCEFVFQMLLSYSAGVEMAAEPFFGPVRMVPYCVLVEASPWV